MKSNEDDAAHENEALIVNKQNEEITKKEQPHDDSAGYCNRLVILLWTFFFSVTCFVIFGLKLNSEIKINSPLKCNNTYRDLTELASIYFIVSLIAAFNIVLNILNVKLLQCFFYVSYYLSNMVGTAINLYFMAIIGSDVFITETMCDSVLKPYILAWLSINLLYSSFLIFFLCCIVIN